jgi:small subunit ribosomal protein S1
VPVEGKVAGVVKGGFEITVAGLRAFCPLSQIDDVRVEDQSTYLGQTLEFAVIEFKYEGRRIVLSRRRLLAAESERRAAETRAKLQVGAVLTGRVVSLAAFGAFVDLGGVQGLLHVSEISHERLERPSDALSLGQDVTVQILKIDPATGKLALSAKALAGDPWAQVGERLRERQVVDGRVVRTTDFGAFVELLPGIDGLLHTSELPHGSLAKAPRGGAGARRAVRHRARDRHRQAPDRARARSRRASRPARSSAGPARRSATSSPASSRRSSPSVSCYALHPASAGVIPSNETGVPRGTDLAREFSRGSEVTAE